MIGSVEGIYHLNLSNKTLHVDANTFTFNIITMTCNALWHFRLGHLSRSRMALLNLDLPFIVVDKKGICDVFHLEKKFLLKEVS